MAAKSAAAHASFKASDLMVAKVILGIAIFVMIVVMFNSCGKTSTTSKGPEVDNTTAWVMVQDYVSSALKAPSTAKFPPSFDEGVHISETGYQTYECRGYVDSQNSFGAMMRTNFTCTVRHVGGGRWELVDVKYY